MPDLTRIIEAVAERLNAAGVAAWDGMSAPVPDGDVGPRVWVKHYPTAVPSLTVTVYDQETTPDEGATVTYRFQVRTRAYHNADPLADAALAALDGQHHQEWAGVPVARCRHASTAQLGLDGQVDERTDNYELITRKATQ